MNIRQALHQIESAARAYAAREQGGGMRVPMEAQRPLFLIGPPGVGKTEIVRQAAARLGIGLVSYTMTHHTRQSALGLPRIVERCFDGEACACTEYTMSEIIAGVRRYMEDTGLRRGILFLDEINCVSETLTPAMMELLQRKRFGQHAVPEGWMIVCAGNPEEYNRAARAFDPVMMDRLRVLKIEADLPAWMDYAAARGVHPVVRGYLRLRPEDFCAVEGGHVVTPRSWTDLSDMIWALQSMGEAADGLLFEQYLQLPEIAERFGLYAAMCGGVAARFSLDCAMDGRADDAAEAFARANFEETLCAAMMLSAGLNQRAEALARAEEAAQRLDSFVCGACRAEGDCMAACREQLARMEHALVVRRGAGVLTTDAESRDRALFELVRAAMRDAAGAEDARAALRNAAEERLAAAKAMRPELRRAFENALRFADRALQNIHARAIFLSELKRAPASLRLLERELPEAWATLVEDADPNRRAAEMRRRMLDAE